MRIFKYMLVVLSLCFVAKGKAQLYDSLTGGLPDEVKMAYYDSTFDKLYISGWFGQTSNSVPIHEIGSWDGVQWGTLSGGFLSPPEFGGFGGWALAGARYQGQLYFTGPISFVDTMTIHGTARWNGTSWDSLPNNYGVGGYDMVTHDSSLYICGNINGIGPDNSIKMVARWNGTQWSAVGNPMTIIKPGFTATCMVFLNDDLYVGGSFDRITGEPIHLLKWDGVNWSVPGNGLQEGGISNIWDIEVYKNEVYITGNFSKFATGGSGTSQHITRWDGTQFKDVGGIGPDQWCTSLCVHNGKLYLGGTFTTINGIPARALATFDGTDWCGYNTTSIVGLNKIAGYRGDTLALCGGWFIEGGDTIQSTLALWTGDSFVDTCRALTAGVYDAQMAVNTLQIYPNPNNGLFTLQFAQPISGNIIVIDAFGNTVYQKQCSIENRITLDLSSVSRGVYFVSVISGQSRSVSRVIIE